MISTNEIPNPLSKIEPPKNYWRQMRERNGGSLGSRDQSSFDLSNLKAELAGGKTVELEITSELLGSILTGELGKQGVTGKAEKVEIGMTGNRGEIEANIKIKQSFLWVDAANPTLQIDFGADGKATRVRGELGLTPVAKLALRAKGVNSLSGEVNVTPKEFLEPWLENNIGGDVIGNVDISRDRGRLYLKICPPEKQEKQESIPRSRTIPIKSVKDSAWPFTESDFPLPPEENENVESVTPVDKWVKRISKFTIEDCSSGSRTLHTSVGGENLSDKIFGNGKITDATKYPNVRRFYLGEDGVLGVMVIPNTGVDEVAVCVSYRGVGTDGKRGIGTYATQFIISKGDVNDLLEDIKKDQSIVQGIVEKLNDGPLGGLNISWKDKLKIYSNTELGGNIEEFFAKTEVKGVPIAEVAVTKMQKMNEADLACVFKGDDEEMRQIAELRKWDIETLRLLREVQYNPLTIVELMVRIGSDNWGRLTEISQTGGSELWRGKEWVKDLLDCGDKN